VRGLLSRTGPRVLRVEPRLRGVADRPDAATIVAGGVASADQMLWIKPRSVLLASPGDADAVTAAVAASEADYAVYYAANRDRLDVNLPNA
jgi:rhamnose utilization protein RhaD (predicted bifunctional aldolase and dehydrogenase)